MSILIFDTETTTFPSKNLPATDPRQARIVQLAWLLLGEDWKEMGSFSSLIRLPEHVEISPGAQSAHGITKEMCQKYGTSMGNALDIFNDKLHNSAVVVAHNIGFDRQLIDIEQTIIFGAAYYDWNNPRNKCTMQWMTPICKLPPKFKGSTDYKWPKLQEAYKHCFGKEFEGAHDALADVRATAAVFRWLVDNKHVTI